MFSWLARLVGAPCLTGVTLLWSWRIVPPCWRTIPRTVSGRSGFLVALHFLVTPRGGVASLARAFPSVVGNAWFEAIPRWLAERP